MFLSIPLRTYDPFEVFSLQHLAPIVITAIIGYLCIRYARPSSDKIQRIIGASIAMIPFLSVSTRMVYLAFIGQFTIEGDLPLHLCRVIALIAPFVMFYKLRFWLGILYFWIFIGTLGANIFPDLNSGFPSLEYFLFWFLHSVLVILPFYIVFVYMVKINIKDILMTYLATNVFMLVCWGLNIRLGSNYFYTMKKPNTGGLLDFLGEYPVFLLNGQLIMLGFFLVFYLPFAFNRAGGLTES